MLSVPNCPRPCLQKGGNSITLSLLAHMTSHPWPSSITKTQTISLPHPPTPLPIPVSPLTPSLPPSFLCPPQPPPPPPPPPITMAPVGRWPEHNEMEMSEAWPPLDLIRFHRPAALRDCPVQTDLLDLHQRICVGSGTEATLPLSLSVDAESSGGESSRMA